MSLYFPTANGIETDNFFYFIAKKRNPIGKIVVRQMHVHRIALHPKGAAAKIGCPGRPIVGVRCGWPRGHGHLVLAGMQPVA